MLVRRLAAGDGARGAPRRGRSSRRDLGDPVAVRRRAPTGRAGAARDRGRADALRASGSTTTWPGSIDASAAIPCSARRSAAGPGPAAAAGRGPGRRCLGDHRAADRVPAGGGDPAPDDPEWGIRLRRRAAGRPARRLRRRRRSPGWRRPSCRPAISAPGGRWRWSAWPARSRPAGSTRRGPAGDRRLLAIPEIGPWTVRAWPLRPRRARRAAWPATWPRSSWSATWPGSAGAPRSRRSRGSTSRTPRTAASPASLVAEYGALSTGPAPGPIRSLRSRRLNPARLGCTGLAVIDDGESCDLLAEMLSRGRGEGRYRWSARRPRAAGERERQPVVDHPVDEACHSAVSM